MSDESGREAPSLLVNIQVNSDKIGVVGEREKEECGRADFRLFNLLTGEIVGVRCDRWDCPKCSRLKAWKWSQRVELAMPRRYVTLTNIGADLDEACGRIAYFHRVLRRDGYFFEELYVPELTPDRGLLHCHMLQHGRDWKTGKEAGFIPVRVLSDAARRAGMGKVVYIERIREVVNVSAYTMKNVMGYTFKDAAAQALWAANPGRRRVRYTENFFPAPVAELDDRLRSERGDIGRWVMQVRDPRSGLWVKLRPSVEQLAAAELEE